VEFPRQREVEVEVPLRDSHFRISPESRPRVIAWSVALLSLPCISYYVSGTAELFVVAPLSVIFLFFLLLFYSMPGQTRVLESTKVTNFYSRGYLWFIGIFITLLIGTIIWLLWRRFPH
jgi:hypothetical protein